MKRGGGLFCAAVLCAGLCARGGAQTYPGARDFADPVSGAGAAGAAMGSTGLVRPKSAAAQHINPAVLPALEGSGLSLSFGPVLMEEKFAESAVQTRVNRHAYFEANEISLAFHGTERLWLGLGLRPAWDFHYRTSFTQFDGAGNPAWDARLRGSGALWALSPALAWAPSEKFSLGAAADILWGEEKISAARVARSGGTDAAWNEEAVYRGWAPRLGLRWTWGESWGAGAVFQPPSEVARRFDLRVSTAPARGRGGREKWMLPALWSAGLSYKAPGGAAEAALEIRHAAWSRWKIDGRRAGSAGWTKPLFQELASAAPTFFGAPAPAPPAFGDTVELAAGVEHALSPRWALRYGLRHLPSYSDRAVEATFFTVGAGRKMEGWSWSAAGEFGKRDRPGDDLLLPAALRTDETFRRLLVGAEFPW
ncbi:MAG: hypothetical protein ACT4O3_06095 [Elusimicrobiota bacterium]